MYFCITFCWQKCIFAPQNVMQKYIFAQQNVQQNAPMVINFLSLNLVNKMFALFSQGQTKRRTKTNCFGFCLQKTQYLQVYGTIAAGYNFSFYIKKAKEENLKKQALLLIP